MATKRRPRPARSDDTVEMGPGGVMLREPPKKPSPPEHHNESSQEEEEEEQEQEEERAQQEKKGEEEAGKASPVRNVVADEVAASPRPKEGKPSGEVAASPKPKMAAKSPALPPSREKEGSEEEEEQQMEEDEESGEATPGKNAPADGTAASSPERKKRTKPSGEVAASPEPKKMAATSPGPKRGVKSPSPRKRSKASGEVAASHKPKKRDATPTVEVHETVEALSEMGAPADGTAVSPPVPKKRSKPSRGKNAASPQRKKKKKVKPSAKSQLESIGEEEEEEEEEVVVVVEQVPAQNTTVLLEKVGRTEEEQADEDEEQVDQSSEALPVVNALSAKLCNSKQEKKLAVERTKLEKKPAVQRSWSKDDELRILRALVEHARIHDGELPEPSDLFTILAASFDRKDADAGRFASKIKKLRLWHGKMHLQGRPTDDHGSQLYDLCDKVWGWGNGALKNTGHGNTMVLRRSPRNINNRGHVVLPQEAHQEVDAGACKISFVERVKDGDVSLGKREGSRGRVAKDKQVKVTLFRREFDELSRLYPYLAKEVEGYADKHSSVDGKLIMEAFEAIGDDEASNLDASFKKQRIDMFNLEVKLVCTLSGLMN